MAKYNPFAKKAGMRKVVEQQPPHGRMYNWDIPMKISYIFDKNDGYCWHCGKKLAFTNYGRHGKKGAWEVDHSHPLSKGGTDYLRNLVPSYIGCNRSKGNLGTREFENY